MESIYQSIIFILSVAFLATLLIKAKPSSKNLDVEWHENYIEELNKEIIAKSKQVTLLDTQIENKTIDKNVSLTKIEINVLDVYDKSGIRIPSDIIEDLSYMRLDNEKAIMDYIENQRTFWRLENTKKPFKGVSK